MVIGVLFFSLPFIKQYDTFSSFVGLLTNRRRLCRKDKLVSFLMVATLKKPG